MLAKTKSFRTVGTHRLHMTQGGFKRITRYLMKATMHNKTNEMITKPVSHFVARDDQFVI